MPTTRVTSPHEERRLAGCGAASSCSMAGGGYIEPAAAAPAKSVNMPTMASTAIT